MREGYQLTEAVEAATAGDLPSALRSYQWQGVRFLASRCSALLADEMGLGKTVQVAVALSMLLGRGEASRALIIVPASLRLNWQRELGRWATRLSVRVARGGRQDRMATYRLPVNIVVASYEQVRMDSVEIARTVDFDVVVLDEAQRIKNLESDTALACRVIRRHCSWALTGTPIENSVTDLSSLFRFIRPGLLRHGMSRPEIHSAMQDFFLRRRKTEVLSELPPIVVQDIPLDLEGRQREAYEAMWARRDSLHGPDVAATALLGLITKLKQICNFDQSSNQSAKLDALRVILESVTGPDDKVIVFSQFVSTLRWAAREMGRGLPMEILHGGLDQEARESVIARFNGEPGPRLLLVSLRAGGVGLNLQAASSVVLFDRWWNPAVEDQAIHRAHRFGRDRHLHVYRFLVVDSVEERIAEILDEKRAVFDEYVEGATSAPTSTFTRDELVRILRLH